MTILDRVRRILRQIDNPTPGPSLAAPEKIVTAPKRIVVVLTFPEETYRRLAWMAVETGQQGTGDEALCGVINLACGLLRGTIEARNRGDRLVSRDRNGREVVVEIPGGQPSPGAATLLRIHPEEPCDSKP